MQLSSKSTEFPNQHQLSYNVVECNDLDSSHSELWNLQMYIIFPYIASIAIIFGWFLIHVSSDDKYGLSVPVLSFHRHGSSSPNSHTYMLSFVQFCVCYFNPDRKDTKNKINVPVYQLKSKGRNLIRFSLKRSEMSADLTGKEEVTFLN